jgi:hypothetical protein
MRADNLDWKPAPRRRPITIDQRLTWEDRFWADKTVGRLCTAVFRFSILIWKIILAIVLTGIVAGSIIVMSAILHQV